MRFFWFFLALALPEPGAASELVAEAYLPPRGDSGAAAFSAGGFFEPLQRLMRRTLRQTAQTEDGPRAEVDGPITEVARLGDQAKLRKFLRRVDCGAVANGGGAGWR